MSTAQIGVGHSHQRGQQVHGQHRCGVGDQHTYQHEAEQGVLAAELELVERVAGHDGDEPAEHGPDARVEHRVAHPAQEHPVVLGKDVADVFEEREIAEGVRAGSVEVGGVLGGGEEQPQHGDDHVGGAQDQQAVDGEGADEPVAVGLRLWWLGRLGCRFCGGRGRFGHGICAHDLFILELKRVTSSDSNAANPAMMIEAAAAWFRSCLMKAAS